MTLWGMRAADDMEQNATPGLSDWASSKQRYDDAKSTRDTAVIASYALYGLGAAALATSVVLFLSGDSGADASASESAAGVPSEGARDGVSHVTLAPMVLPAGSGLAASLRF